MGNVFYTYIWGYLNRGGPLTFTSKKDRTVAVRSTKEGDIVFGVVSSNPRDPTVHIPEEFKGRVVNAWQISHRTANTADFGIDALNPWDTLEGKRYRWPFALQPIRAWSISDPPKFRDLRGYTSSTHTQRAVTTVQEVTGELATTLMDLLVANGEEQEVLTPRYLPIAALVRELKQKHPFALRGYTVQPNTEAMNSIYIATLGKEGRVLKIGHAQDAGKRVSEFNKYRLSTEPQWVLHTAQIIGSVLDAIEVEKFLGEVFAQYRTEENNEVYVGLDPQVVLIRLATVQLKAIRRAPSDRETHPNRVYDCD